MNLTEPSSKNPNIINMKKGDIVSLVKLGNPFDKLLLGAGWNPSTNGPSADLDIAAILLNKEGKLEMNGGTLAHAQDVVFFNAKDGGCVKLHGDNLTGNSNSQEDDDDEKITINLSEVPQRISKIVFVVTIFDAERKKQTFSMINNAYVRLLDINNPNSEEEIALYTLTESFSSSTGVIFASLERNTETNLWDFEAIGEGFVGSLNDALYKFL